MSAGDPASVSALASALRAAGAELKGRAEVVGAAASKAATGWSGRAALEHRRTADHLVGALTVCGERLTALSAALQEYASDLAESHGALREVHEEARRAGLRIVDGVVATGWGITGEADPADERGRRERAQRVQHHLDSVLTVRARRSARLTRVCEEARLALAESASTISR